MFQMVIIGLLNTNGSKYTKADCFYLCPKERGLGDDEKNGEDRGES